MSESLNTNTRLVTGHQWGVQLQREIDVLLAANEGRGASALILALATEAVIADNGTLTDSLGKPGYAWTPGVYQKKAGPDWITSRIRAAGSSIGRVMSGGHPSHRTYLAVIEALYVVTTQQSYDVAERIERLWDEAAARKDIEEQEEHERGPGLFRRMWSRFLAWWHASYDPTMEDDR